MCWRESVLTCSSRSSEKSLAIIRSIFLLSMLFSPEIGVNFCAGAGCTIFATAGIVRFLDLYFNVLILPINLRLIELEWFSSGSFKEVRRIGELGLFVCWVMKRVRLAHNAEILMNPRRFDVLSYVKRILAALCSSLLHIGIFSLTVRWLRVTSLAVIGKDNLWDLSMLR